MLLGLACLVLFLFLMIKYTSIFLENLRMILFLPSDGKGGQASEQSEFNKTPVVKLRNCHTLDSLVSSGISKISIYSCQKYCEFFQH